MSIQDVLLQYEARIQDLQRGLADLRSAHVLTGGALGLAILLLFVLGIYALRRQVSYVWPSLQVPVAAFSARRLRENRRSQSRLWRLRRFYDRAVQRANGEWAGCGQTGEEFLHPEHVYARDLHLFGEGSLFELLCVARTSIGQRGLAKYLLETPAVEESLSRQEAVRELRDRTDVRESLATLGDFEFRESKFDTFDAWLIAPELRFPSVLPAISLATSTLVAVLIVAAFAGLKVLSLSSPIAPLFYSLIAFHTIIGLCFRSRAEQMQKFLGPVAAELGVLRDGLQLLEREEFQSLKLQQLADRARNGFASLGKLQRYLGVFEQRNKDWFYGPSRILLAGTQACMAVEQWRRAHGDELRLSLDAFAEFEALNSLAVHSHENPDHVFPEFPGNETCFHANALGHPMLPRDSCVTNEVDLSREIPFYVISGSNMSGKSTLLRAIGVNAVLAFAGAAVRARSMRLSGLTIFASLAITDSLLNGKSKFLAEVDRLRRAIESQVENRPVLFLVDEILSGTNSRDRRIAAEAIVHTLVGRGAIGALSTHDLALTEIGTSNGMTGINVHMGSREGSGPLGFDYRLKPGITHEANALAIARLAGVPV